MSLKNKMYTSTSRLAILSEWPFSGSLKVSRWTGKFCTVLYRLVYQVLSAIQINKMSALWGDVCIARIRPIVGTLRSVRIIEVSTFQECAECHCTMQQVVHTEQIWYWHDCKLNACNSVHILDLLNSAMLCVLYWNMKMSMCICTHVSFYKATKNA